MTTMRKVPLKTVKSDEAEFTYAGLLLQLLKTPKRAGQGTSIEEMEKVLPIIKIFKGIPVDAAHLLLSEGDWKELDERLTQTFKPAQNLEELLVFVKDVQGAEKVEVEVTEVK